jgi:hypothetical protein
MFVRSKMSIPVKYNKGNDFIELKPNTVTYVSDALITAQELKNCYGERIEIMSNDQVEDCVEQQIIENEIAKGDEANTGDEEVDDFLNGKTDVVPGGTVEITEEEALKLKAQAEAEARAKEEAEKLEALKAKELAEKAKAKEAKKPAKAATKKGTKKNK